MASANGSPESHHRLSAGMVLITLGIVFGDIGTSPLYAVSAIMGKRQISELLVLGGISAVFWTLTLQTTLKYVIITLRADNKGEGGIFSLYALIRRRRGWLFYPAIIGGGFLIADGFITPPISVSSAIEGLRAFDPEIETVPIVLAIIAGLFFLQQFGTASVGTLFGPIMLVWFTSIGMVGLWAVAENPAILKALSPHYALELIATYPDGFWLLGAVFLCTTGAEALYSDLGHCGRANIRVSWTLVKLMLLLNYFGQGAHLLGLQGQVLGEERPFYMIVPQWGLAPMIIIATLATIVASQALISGTFTLINEAIRLDLSPRLRILYPASSKGQLYIPAINALLFIGCVAVVLLFKESEAMEAAYGLAVTITMLTTTVLLTQYLLMRRVPRVWVISLTLLFIAIEGSFLVANSIKFLDGAYFSLGIGLVLTGVLWTWHAGRKIKNQMIEEIPIKEYLPVLIELSNDHEVPKFATHLVYLTWSADPHHIDRRVIYSILNRQPKRADIYWFLNIQVVDDPYCMNYQVMTLARHDVVYIQFHLGFKVQPRINLFFRKVIESMVKNGEVDITSRYESLGRYKIAGDFHFVLLKSFLSYDNELVMRHKLLMKAYFFLSRASISDERNFGLDTSSVTIEKVPLIITPPSDIRLNRLPNVIDPTLSVAGK